MADTANDSLENSASDRTRLLHLDSLLLELWTDIGVQMKKNTNDIIKYSKTFLSCFLLQFRTILEVLNQKQKPFSQGQDTPQILLHGVIVPKLHRKDSVR